MAYLLDTNSWIAYLKSEQSKVRQRLASVTPQDVAVCSIVKAELWYGALKYGNRQTENDPFETAGAIPIFSVWG